MNIDKVTLYEVKVNKYLPNQYIELFELHNIEAEEVEEESQTIINIVMKESDYSHYANAPIYDFIKDKKTMLFSMRTEQFYVRIKDAQRLPHGRLKFVFVVEV